MTKSEVIKAIFFDLDGTLIDTEPAAGRAIEKCFEKVGVKLKPGDADFITGRTWESAFEYLFSIYSVAVPHERIKSNVLRTYRQELKRELPEVTGSAEAVRCLAEKFPLAVVSGSTRSDILWALDRLKIRHCFKTVVGAEDYPKSKPAPDPYLTAMKELGIKPGHGLAFEDSLAGITSANAAGLYVVAISATNHLKQDTTQAHAKIKDLQGITPQWIEEFSSGNLKAVPSYG
ncbi:HAD family phosphatase [Bdellovibrionota bacterium FG-2]